MLALSRNTSRYQAPCCSQGIMVDNRPSPALEELAFQWKRKHMNTGDDVREGLGGGWESKGKILWRRWVG
jgi:hypothetical protein